MSDAIYVVVGKMAVHFDVYQDFGGTVWLSAVACGAVATRSIATLEDAPCLLELT